MKNFELVKLWNLLDGMKTQKLKREFVFLLYENKMIIKNKVEALKKASESIPEYETFETKRLSLCRKYAATDDNGAPKTLDNRFVIKQDSQDEFDGQLMELTTEYQECIEAQKQRVDEVNKLMDRDIEPEIEFVSIPRNLLPETLSLQDVEILMPLME